MFYVREALRDFERVVKKRRRDPRSKAATRLANLGMLKHTRRYSPTHTYVVLKRHKYERKEGSSRAGSRAICTTGKMDHAENATPPPTSRARRLSAARLAREKEKLLVRFWMRRTYLSPLIIRARMPGRVDANVGDAGRWAGASESEARIFEGANCRDAKWAARTVPRRLQCDAGGRVEETKSFSRADVRIRVGSSSPVLSRIVPPRPRGKRASCESVTVRRETDRPRGDIVSIRGEVAAGSDARREAIVVCRARGGCAVVFESLDRSNSANGACRRSEAWGEAAGRVRVSVCTRARDITRREARIVLCITARVTRLLSPNASSNYAAPIEEVPGPRDQRVSTLTSVARGASSP